MIKLPFCLKIVFLFAALAGLLSCREPDSEITHCWKVNRIQIEEPVQMAAFPDFREPQTLDNCFLRFYPNQTAVIWQKEQGYSVYQWSYSPKNEAYLVSGPGAQSSLQFRMVRREGESAKLAVLNDADRETGVNLLISTTRLYEDDEMDLLHPDMNAWRLRPARRESPKELEKRVWGMVNFVVNYFELIERKDQRYFETPILQSPFRFYSGGIGITREEALPDAWVNCFYDKEDVHKAYLILTDAFDKDIEYPKDTRKHTEGYLKVLKAVRFNLE